jgi:uncharacterized protein (DUF2141 family)
MKIAATLIGFTALCSALASGAASAGDLKVEVHGITETKGDVLVAVFNQKGLWLKQSLISKKIAASTNKVVVLFEGLPEGDYAVSAVHDLNSNGHLDRNPIGMPTEPYGFSNDATGNFGPPSFDSAKITLTQAVHSISVRVN